MQGNSISYFVRGNTSKGEISFFASNFGNLKSVIRIKRYPRMQISDMLQAIGNAALEQGEDVQWIHSALDNIIEGVIFPARQVGVYQDVALGNEQPQTEGRVFDGLDCIKPKHVNGLKTKLRMGRQAYKKEMERAYQYFAQGLKIHDAWERIYIKQLDFDKIDRLTLQLIHDFLGDKRIDKEAKKFERFLGCATADGPVDYVESLTAAVEKRYFIKGRPGTGKSTLLKKLAKSAGDKGFDVEIYHCGFDPASLDMVILRELGICIFDSTAPHEYFPTRETDEIIDVYQIAKKSDVDKERAQELEAVQKDYRASIRAATSCLKHAKDIADATDELFGKAIEKRDIDALYDQLREVLWKH